MAGQFDGKVALVTGAGAGIGRATALAFAGEGARVVVADLAEDGGLETQHLIAERGGQAIFVQADVARAVSVEGLIDRTIATYGRLDYAHNNAGVGSGGRWLTPDLAEEAWDRILAINLKGVWLCLKYEIPPMLRQGGGAIVNTASVLGLVGAAYGSAYVASKHGVVGLTRAAALEYAAAGIRINAVCPGYVDTAMIAPSLSDPERAAQMLAREPIGRVGRPEEIAAAVVWLCSDAASFVTGHAMSVDGGWSTQ